ncbi:MAG: Asp-tRNA(Asn)/Glu-tRNA(Gln) amidotransferase subunit GatA [Patescibacteria group bacterium]|jgi:aspartyl-tRNA(Asn)/glutamyl-tRNA(Gln) amidotransferase subunit A|nr:Asp-tRNA(Asn)/Glu-tRNA(Gln) amidotransferase subunit GatA [Patescibacteria group bacterium]
MEIKDLTIRQTNEALKKKEFSSLELAKAYLARIEKLNEKLNVFITVTPEVALANAQAADEQGDFSNPLAGIPTAHKDVFCTKGIRSTGASKILSNYIPPYESTATEKLKQAGAVTVGKVNCDEFAMGGSGENSGYGFARNPWDLERVPGGSCSGSAAGVAASMCLYSLGTDTGGSIRQPAGFCGVTGLKVTYGRVSRSGVMAMASSLDTIGPITKNVEDAAIVLKQIAGHDPKDSTTPEIKVDDYPTEILADIKGLKLGLPKQYFIDGMDGDVKDVIMAAVKKLESMGAKIVDIDLPHTAQAVAIYYIVVPSEVSSNMARYDGIRYGASEPGDNLLDIYLNTRSQHFGAEVKRRIMLGTYALSAGYYDAYYKKAMQARTLVRNDFDQAFEKVDAIITPTSPTPAFKIGENTADPLKMYLADVFTIPASLAGICGLSVTAGFTRDLPVGMQILGKRFDEKTILRIGHQYQQATDWHTRKPDEID